MTALPAFTRRITWGNFQSGGMTKDGTLDVDRLRRFVAPFSAPPPHCSEPLPVAVFVLCEAKQWGADGNRGLLTAAEVLSETLGGNYDGKLCSFDRGPIGPAVFWDPALVRPARWPDDNGHPGYPDQTDAVRFRVVGTKQYFVIIPRHWAPTSPQQRTDQARLLGRYGDDWPEPVAIIGDLNATPSGPRWPRRDWTKAHYRDRDAKAIWVPDGTPAGKWIDATDALDHLIGRWVDHPDYQGRIDGCGFRAVPEIAYATGTPLAEAFQATVNRGIDLGGGQIIDHCLLNRPDIYVAGSYRTHVPARQYNGRWDSDHRPGEATVNLAAKPGSLTYINAELARQFGLAA
jgi:hypothetical protein